MDLAEGSVHVAIVAPSGDDVRQSVYRMDEWMGVDDGRFGLVEIEAYKAFCESGHLVYGARVTAWDASVSEHVAKIVFTGAGDTVGSFAVCSESWWVREPPAWAKSPGMTSVVVSPQDDPGQNHGDQSLDGQIVYDSLRSAQWRISEMKRNLFRENQREIFEFRAARRRRSRETPSTYVGFMRPSGPIDSMVIVRPAGEPSWFSSAPIPRGREWPSACCKAMRSALDRWVRENPRVGFVAGDVVVVTPFYGSFDKRFRLDLSVRRRLFRPRKVREVRRFVEFDHGEIGPGVDGQGRGDEDAEKRSEVVRDEGLRRPDAEGGDS